MGLVYLLHFDKKLHHAQHYIGFVEKPSNLERRMEYHMSGRGCKLIKAVVNAGITFDIARVWKNSDRNFERSLKNKKKARCLCPKCISNIKVE